MYRIKLGTARTAVLFKLGTARTAALAIVCATLPACGIGIGAALDSGGSSNPGTTPVTPLASIRPLSEYTPFGPMGALRVPFWKKHLPDSVPNFQFEIALDEPVPNGGAMLWYELDGTAQAGVHYQVGASNPISVPAGATEVVIPVELLNSGEFFLERFLSFEMTQANGLELDPTYFRAELWIRPSIDPPTLSFPIQSLSNFPGESSVVPVFLSHVSQDPVTLYYDVAPLGDLQDITMPPSGTVTFAPGQTAAQIPYSIGNSAATGQSLQLNLRHERNGVRYTVPAIDPLLTSNSDVFPQPIHLDENMWTHSVGGVQAFEYDDTRNPAPRGISLPGNPSDNITGGSFWEPGMEDRELIDLLDQTNPTPVTDPFSGLPLKIYAIAEAASGVAPYLRKSFNSSFCGGITQLYTLPQYARISYYLRLPEGFDAARAVPFARIGMRFRSLNFNHGVTFRVGSDGFDSVGNPVPVVQTSMGPIGVWREDQTNPNTDLFGVVEDEFGVRLWYAHKLDPLQPWTHPLTGNTIFEVPGETSGNPIEYPTWVSTGDGSLAAMGLSSVDDATGMGNMSYGYFWEISDDASIFNGNLNPYFPKPRSWWEPMGNAVLDESTSLTFSIL